MRSSAWYEANSFCADGETRHEGTKVLSVAEELVGYVCIHCFEVVRPVRRGSDLWVMEDARTSG